MLSDTLQVSQSSLLELCTLVSCVSVQKVTLIPQTTWHIHNTIGKFLKSTNLLLIFSLWKVLNLWSLDWQNHVKWKITPPYFCSQVFLRFSLGFLFYSWTKLWRRHLSLHMSKHVTINGHHIEPIITCPQTL